MDSLTQIVLGAAVGEAALGRKVGNKAIVYGAIAGTIPDLDIIVGNFFDTVTALEIHRGFSHSIGFAILLSPILGYVLSKIHSDANFKNWTWMMFWCLFTHPLLDMFTTWGTQLFWPFEYRLAFKSIFVIDPLYTLPFLTCLVLAMRFKKSHPKRRKINRLGLYVSTFYLLISLFLKFIGYQKFESALENQNINYIEMDTRPSAFNTLLWSANVKTKSAFLIGEYSFFDSKPISFRRFPKNHEKISHLSQFENLERLKDVTKGWYTITKKNENLYLNDLRFGLISMDTTQTKFAFSYKLVATEQGIEIQEEPKTPEDGKKLLKELWMRLKGN
ncbi:metal-dependent hydrolase [Psychroflexus aestuariivivens]|uniref:metal-dependent hydrolase n=1 Tax=Psychroflexus aestuariivivens TaxID=1795040 RepID=UPI000FDB7A89|nr:metal-dependent hydrolase [Psychroflexus aestuariivivens]